MKNFQSFKIQKVFEVIPPEHNGVHLFLWTERSILNTVKELVTDRAFFLVFPRR